MDYKKITYIFNIGNEVLKKYCLMAEETTNDDLKQIAEQVFQKAMKEAGKTQEEIDKADYMLAIVKGWC